MGVRLSPFSPSFSIISGRVGNLFVSSFEKITSPAPNASERNQCDTRGKKGMQQKAHRCTRSRMRR